MPFEDMGMMRLIPHLVILEPSDPVSLEKLLEQNAAYYGCSYMRLHRKAVPPLYKPEEEFALGKSKVLRDGNDITIAALGAIMVPEALKAAKLLEEQGISAAVIDVLTVKPLDRDLILSYAAKTGKIVTAENHQINGGFGGAVAELLARERPTPMAMIGVNDEFGEVGTQEWLQERFKLSAAEIVKQALALINK
jgi:transketolase